MRGELAVGRSPNGRATQWLKQDNFQVCTCHSQAYFPFYVDFEALKYERAAISGVYRNIKYAILGRAPGYHAALVACEAMPRTPVSWSLMIFVCGVCVSFGFIRACMSQGTHSQQKVVFSRIMGHGSFFPHSSTTFQPRRAK